MNSVQISILGAEDPNISAKISLFRNARDHRITQAQCFNKISLCKQKINKSLSKS